MDSEEMTNIVKPIPPGIKRPLWSVMIPTFNPGIYFADAINSVISQDLGPEFMQIDVVDDCSTKVDVEKIVRENWKGRVGYHKLPKNVGHSFNFTESVRRAKGELVHLLHDDDKVKPGFYSKFESIFRKYKEAGAVFCRQEYIDDDGKFMFYSEPEMEETGILDNALIRLAEKQRIQYCAMVVRRKVYEQIGGYIPKNIGCEDWEMWVRIAAHFQIAYEPEALAEYRIHRKSMTLTDMRTGQDMRFLREAADIFTQYLPEEKREEVTIFRRKHYAAYSFNNAKRMYEEFNDEEGAAAQLSETIKLNSEIVYENLDFISKFKIPVNSTGVSVIINCQNDEKLIERTLRHLIIQKVPEYIPWEIILVDNGSSDNTLKVAEETWKKYNGKTPFRFIKLEPTSVFKARSKAIENTKYNFVLFCNPGNLLSRNYVRNVSHNLMRDIDLGAIGGYIESKFKTEAPLWFEEWSKSSYQVGEQFEYTNFITWSRGYLWSAGMAIRKEAWKSLLDKNFRSVLENKFDKISTLGVDKELCYALRLNGWSIWYSVDLKLKNFIPDSDLNWKHLRDIRKQAGENFVTLYPYLNFKGRKVSDYRKIPTRINNRKLISKTYRKLKLYKGWKLKAYKETLYGDSDQLKIEYEFGKLRELFKNIKSYNNKVRLLKRIARKKDFKYLKYVIEKPYFRFPQYQNEKDKRGITIVLTYNNSSYNLLLRSLDKILLQQLPADFRWEVILVGNFIEKDIKKEIHRKWETSNCTASLRISEQTFLHPDTIRNFAAEISKYEYLIFMNECVLINSDYVRIAYKAIHKNKKAGIMGGQTDLASEVKPPKWFNNYKELFAIGRQADQSGDVTFSRGYLWNTGIVARKEALQQINNNIYDFNYGFGINKDFSLHFDLDFSNKIKLSGWKILYEERLRLEHFIPVNQFNWVYLRKLYYSRGIEEVKESAFSKLFNNVKKAPDGKERYWLYNANKTLGELKKFPLKKIFSRENEYNGDTDVLEIEKLQGKFKGLLKAKNKYHNSLSEIKESLNGKMFKDLSLSQNGFKKEDNNNKKGVSIIVCCYNSSGLVPRTLKYICTQDVPDNIPWEIIIVDNASTDNTSEVAQDTWNKFNCLASFKIVKETEPGLSAARLKGFNTARHEYLVFCDDDNLLHKDFVKTAFDIMSSHDDIGVLGGQSKAEFDQLLPKWFKEWQSSFAIGKQSSKAGDITLTRGYVWGAAMVVRKEAWQKLQSRGFKTLLTDRKGNLLSAGGDTEICYALRNAGWKIWYDSRLKFKHHLPVDRLNWEYLRKLFRGFGQASSGLDYYLKNSPKEFKDNNKKLIPGSLRSEIRKTLLTLRSIRYKKLLSFSRNREGDTDIPMMEYCIGRLESLLKTRRTYNRGIKLLKKIAFKKDFRYLSTVLRDYNIKFPRYKIEDKLNGVSIIVCTYNGAERLTDTIKHLALQKVDESILWEIILVDNASTDNSKEVAINEWKKHKCNAKIRIIDQPIPGKQLALEKGYEFAKYEFLITCDDDNWLDENFVQLTYEIMSKNNRIGVLGGPNEPLCEVEPPAWFKHFKKDYAAGPQGDIHSGKISEGNITWKRGYVWGAGMIVRKSAWEKLVSDGFKTSMSCRKGSELSSGGDSETCYALVLAGWEVWYDPRLMLKHCMPAGRLDWNYLIRLFTGFGVASVGLDPYEKAIQLGKADINDEDIKKQNWKYEFRKTLKTLRKYGLKKILSLRFPQDNNTDVLMVEFNLSRLKELIRVRKEYDKNFYALINSPWKKNYSESKANHRKYLEYENDFRYGWPWGEEPVRIIPENKTYPKISILTPSFNSESTIEKAILSVLRQQYPNFEHIIYDGMSNDNTASILKKYSHLRWVSEKDKGQSDAMNKAFEKSEGEIIAYLNADDYFQRGAFFKIADAFEKNPEAEMVVGNLIFDYVGHTFLRISEIEYRKIMLPFLYMFPINPVSYFYKRSMQKAIGPFPLDNHLTMDYWFLLKAYQNHNLVKIEDYLGTFFMNGFNKTSGADNRKNTHHRVLDHCWKHDRKNLPFYLFNYYKFFYYEKTPFNITKLYYKARKNLGRVYSILTLRKNKYYAERLFQSARSDYYTNKLIKATSKVLAALLIYPKGVTQRSRQSFIVQYSLGQKYSEKLKIVYFFFTTPPGLPLANKLHYYGNKYIENNKSLNGNLLLLLTFLISPKFIFKNKRAHPSGKPKLIVRGLFFYLNPFNWVRGLINYFRYKRYRTISSDYYLKAGEKYYSHKNIQATILLIFSFLIYPKSFMQRSRQSFFVRSFLGQKYSEKLKIVYFFFTTPPGLPLANKLHYYGNEFKKNTKSVRGNSLLLLTFLISPKFLFKGAHHSGKPKFSVRRLFYYLNPINWARGLINYLRYKKYKTFSYYYYLKAGEKYYYHKNIQSAILLIFSFLIYPPDLKKKSRLNLFIYTLAGNTLVEKFKFAYHLYRDNPEFTFAYKLNYYGNELRSEGKTIKGNFILLFAYILSPKYILKREKIKKLNVVTLKGDFKIPKHGSSLNAPSRLKNHLRNLRRPGAGFDTWLKNSFEMSLYRIKRLYHYFRYRKFKAQSKELYAQAIENYKNNERFKAAMSLIPSYILYPVSIFNRNKFGLMINTIIGNSLKTKKEENVK